MKKVIKFFFVVAVVSLAVTSCKSKQKVVYISADDVPATEVTETVEPVVSAPVEEAGNAINESFTLTAGDNDAFNRNFHVVVGSFSVQNNAKNLQRELNNEGNNAIVVKNERGMFRVLIASFNDYSQAREKIYQISNRFPDAWVLRQK